MNDEVKEIMRLSFHDSFFVNRYSKKNNFEYLDGLVDYVLDNNDGVDYESIANKIWILDDRIKKMFDFNMEIIPLCFDLIEVNDRLIQQCLNVPSAEDINRILRCSSNMHDYMKKFKVALVLYNWEKITRSEKDVIVECIIKKMHNKFGVNITKGGYYIADKLVEDERLNLALNEMAFWLCEKMDCTFSYQSRTALNSLAYYEKIEMYYQINNELSTRSYNSFKIRSSITNNIVRPIIPEYLEDDCDLVFSDMTDVEKNTINAYIYLKDVLCKYIHQSTKNKLFYVNENMKALEDIQKKEEEIRLLRKKISTLQYEIEKLQKDREKEKIENEYERKLMESELFSLREFVFNRDIENDENEIQSDDQRYIGDYARVVIVGGHSSWHKKVSEHLKGINILSTDQNIVDWTFLKRIDIVIIVTNYISHSMYYRVIDKVKGQKIIYLDYKNIDQLKLELDLLLLKMGNKDKV